MSVKTSKTKKVAGYVKLQVPAGKANPAPPIGTALGPKGLNIMEFCKAFNDKTKNMKPGMPVPVVITYYADRTFTFILKTPPCSYFIKEAAGVSKCTKTPGRDVSGRITEAQVEEIAKQKMCDTNANDLEAVKSMVRGSAISMGIEVVK